jgi:HSP20 family protein
MAVVRWDPSRELQGFQSDMNRIFDAFFQNGDPGGHRRWVPPMDLSEEQDSLVLRVDLPGLGEDDVKVEVDNDVLTLSGERRAEHKTEEGSFYRVERGYGHFSRSFTLPEGIDAESVEGSFDRGVLELRIPKPEEKQPKRVELKSRGTGDSEKTVIEAQASEN